MLLFVLLDVIEDRPLRDRADELATFARSNTQDVIFRLFDGPAGDRYTGRTPTGRVDTARIEAGNVHPEFLTEATRGIGVAWNKVPYALGGWGTSSPGVLLTPDDSIFFAGEHLSILQGWQEGAILSAYHAIDQVVARDTTP